jgi:hypothetical protein
MNAKSISKFDKFNTICITHKIGKENIWTRQVCMSESDEASGLLYRLTKKTVGLKIQLDLLEDDLFQLQSLCFLYRDNIGRLQREVGARTVTVFVFKLPNDREDGNVVGAGELGPIIVIGFYDNRS